MVIADVPSMGLWLGLPIASTIIVLSILWCSGWALSKDYDKWFPFSIGAVVGVITLIIAVIAFWPYKHDYHYWIAKSGKVEQISNRLISDGDSVSQRFVVVIKGQPYGIDDTRASLLKVGDFVKIHCKKEFDWGSSDQGWACKWG